MANSLVLWSLAWLGASLVFIGLPLCRGQPTGSCTTVNPCRCTYSDGSYIDLSKISKIDCTPAQFLNLKDFVRKFKSSYPNIADNGTNQSIRCTFSSEVEFWWKISSNFTNSRFLLSVRFDYTPSTQPGSPFRYAYNPCHPVTDTKDCKNVAACQKNPTDESGKRFPLGDASSADFTGSGSQIAITYSATDDIGTLRSLTVTLVCDQTASTPTLKVPGETGPSTNVYEYTLTSECCCPNGCEAVVYSNGLSFGSILCIIFSCLLFVYLVAGVLYMKFVRKAEGKEVIPNYSMWVQVPGLIKDGGKFTYSKIGQLFGKQSNTYDDI